MINRFAELTDVLSIDSTDPQFKTNMKAGGVSSAPYVLGFHDKEADVREAPTDATVNKIGALVRLEALQNTAPGGPLPGQDSPDGPGIPGPNGPIDDGDSSGVEPISIETANPRDGENGPNGPGDNNPNIPDGPGPRPGPGPNDRPIPGGPMRPPTDGPDTNPMDGPDGGFGAPTDAPDDGYNGRPDNLRPIRPNDVPQNDFPG